MARRGFLLRALVVGGLVPVLNGAASRARGQVVFDGSLGRAGAAPKTATNTLVPADRGRLVGSAKANLFHSFSQFSIPKGESVTFSGPEQVANVLARVTGGSPSTIEGRLSCTIPRANFYLINPAGVVVTADAQLDVSGSFAVSTADYVALGSGGRFDARVPDASVLTTAAPSAFGFVSSSAAPLIMTGATLSVADGKAMSFVGGPVRISGGKLTAAGGRVNVVAAGSAGRVGLDPADPRTAIDTQGLSAMADVDLSGVEVDLQGPETTPGGGGLAVRGANVAATAVSVKARSRSTAPGDTITMQATAGLSITGSSLVASTAGLGDGGGITLEGASVSIAQTQLYSQSSGEQGGGRAGDVRISGGTVLLTDTQVLETGALSALEGNVEVSGDTVSLERSVLSADALGQAHGGNITITAGDLSLHSSDLSASVVTSGTAGTVTVRAGSATFDGGGDVAQTGIHADTESDNPGGNVVVAVDGPLRLMNGAQISSRSHGGGGGGNIEVSAGELSLDGEDTLIAADTDGASRAGDVTVRAGSIRLTNGGVISTSTFGSGAGGTLTVNADEIVAGPTIEAAAGTGALNTGVLSIAFPFAPDQAGRGGDVVVNAKTVRVIGGGQISVDTVGPGDAGTIRLTADQLVLDGTGAPPSMEDPNVGSFTGISAGTFGTDVLPAGRGGSIHVDVKSLQILGGAAVFTTTLNDARGGDVELLADDLLISGASAVQAGTDSLSTGGGGTILVGSEARPLRTLRIDDRGFIASETKGAGSAGAVVLFAQDVALTRSAAISTSTTAESTGDGNGLQIGSAAAKAVDVSIATGSGILASSNGKGKAGNISIVAAGTVSVDGAGTAAGDFTGIRAEAGSLTRERGGDVSIEAGHLTIASGGAVSAATSGAGDGGSVAVLANEVSLSGARSTITAEATDASHEQGSSGDVRIGAADRRVGTLTLSDGGAVRATTGSAKAGGNVHVFADQVTLSGGSSLRADTTAAGNAGGVEVDSGRVEMTGGALLLAQTTGPGHAGHVAVRADDLLISDSAEPTGIQAQTSGEGSGDAGDVVVDAARVAVSGRGVISTASSGSGRGGGVQIALGESLRVSDGGTVSAVSGGSGAGGSVSITGPELALEDGVITATTTGTGPGGSVAVAADRILVRAKASQAGAPSLNAGITADTAGTSPSAVGGGIHITGGPGGAGTGTLRVSGSGTVSAGTSGAARGGSVGVDVGQVELADGGSIRSTSSSGAAGAGEAGAIDVRGRQSVTLKSGGAISARAVAADAGSVRVSSDQVIELIDARRNWMSPGVLSGQQQTANSQITVEAPEGTAGEIKLTATDRVELRNSLVTARARHLGNGGAANSAVSIDPRFVLLDNSIINGRIVGGVGSGNGGGGGGGAGGIGGDVPVFIDPGSTFLRSAESAILSDAVSAPVEVDIAGSLTRLPTGLMGGTMSLVDQCAVRFGGDFSSFVVTGRGGVPPEPAGWSPALPWQEADELRISPPR